MRPPVRTQKASSYSRGSGCSHRYWTFSKIKKTGYTEFQQWRTVWGNRQFPPLQFPVVLLFLLFILVWELSQVIGQVYDGRNLEGWLESSGQHRAYTMRALQPVSPSYFFLHVGPSNTQCSWLVVNSYSKLSLAIILHTQAHMAANSVSFLRISMVKMFNIPIIFYLFVYLALSGQ